MKKILFCFFGLLFCCIITQSQQIDLNNTKTMFSKENLFRINGGLSVGNTLYAGNESSGRKPFTYFLSGNLNLIFASQFSLPFHIHLTNTGANMNYPALPNRLSLHPSYKWVTAHIGDVSMNFSPYTLNGHQFTGLGVDLSPANSLKINAMYGRLQRAVEYDPQIRQTQTTYERIGYGTKFQYTTSHYQVGGSILTAKDNENSLKWKPDSLFIFPQENLALSIESSIQISKNMSFDIEYGISLLNSNHKLSHKKIGDERYHAIRGNLNYLFLQNRFGIRYERIDPGYKTLGAYYFNNDVENISLNYSGSFLRNKLNLSVAGGIEHDDLNRDKKTSNNRFVSSTNINYQHSEKINFNLNYNGFQSYMNLKSQFDKINELSIYDNMDTLDFAQLSHNVSLETIYLPVKNEKQEQFLNFILSYQQTTDKQGDQIKEDGITYLCNSSLGYRLLFVPRQFSFNCNMNVTYQHIYNMKTIILGPTTGINASFYDKKLSSGLSASYNRGLSKKEPASNIWNFRLNTGYSLFKKHQFKLSSVYRNGKTASRKNSSITVTAGYNYSF